MKKQNASLLALLLTASIFFASCHNTTGKRTEALGFDSLRVERTVHLFGDTAKPACNLGISLAYAAGKRHDDIHQVAEVHEDGAERVGVHVRRAARLVEAAVAHVEVLLRGVLVAEDLDDALAVHDLLDVALDDADLLLLRHEVARRAASELLGHVGHEEHASNDDQAHPDAVVDHDGDDRAAGDKRERDVGQRLADHLAQRVDVVGVVTHDVAALVLVKEADWQVLHVTKELLAELLERALRDDGHRAGPGEVEGE